MQHFADTVGILPCRYVGYVSQAASCVL